MRYSNEKSMQKNADSEKSIWGGGSVVLDYVPGECGC